MTSLTRRDFLKATMVGGIGVAAMGLVGCSGGDEPSAPSNSVSAEDLIDAGQTGVEQAEGFIADTVSIATGDPSSYYPLNCTGGGKTSLYEIYECLIDVNGAAGEAYGVIAKDWYFEDGDLVVEMYDYVYDSEGNHITADDVVFSYTRALEEGYDSTKFNSNAYGLDNGVEAVDTYKVVFHWRPDKVDVFNGAIDMLDGQVIVSQAAFEASADSMAVTPVGTCRYTLENYTAGVSATLKRRDDYWQKDESLIGPQHQANVDTINFLFISDSTQVINALRTNDIDFAPSIPQTAIDEFSGKDEWTVSGHYAQRMLQCFFNALPGNVFEDINLRAAVCYAINSDDILQAVGGEAYARTLNEFFCSGTRLYNDDCESWETYYNTCDIDLAKDYLSKSSYDGRTIVIYYDTAEYSDYSEAEALCIGAALEQLGLPYKINPTADIESIAIPGNADWDIILVTVSGNGTGMKYFAKFDKDSGNFGYGNWEDETLAQMYREVNTQSGATYENVSNFNKYLIEKFYCYATLELVLYDCWRSDLIADTSVRTFRDWEVPGGWTYVGE